MDVPLVFQPNEISSIQEGSGASNNIQLQIVDHHKGNNVFASISIDTDDS